MLHAWLNKLYSVLCVQQGLSGTATGRRPDFCDILLCTNMQNVWVNWPKWSSPIMCFSSSSLFTCIAIFERKMSGCVWVFQTLSSFFGGGGLSRTQNSGCNWRSSQAQPPDEFWGGWQSPLSHWSSARWCVYTVNLYIVSLCVLCGNFLLDFFFSCLGSLNPWHKRRHQQNTRV